MAHVAAGAQLTSLKVGAVRWAGAQLTALNDAWMAHVAAPQVGITAHLEASGRLAYMCMEVRRADDGGGSGDGGGGNGLAVGAAAAASAAAGLPHHSPTWRVVPGVCYESLAMQVWPGMGGNRA
eukprot:274131-Chlamydomonas_euryale.AAC.1